MATTIRTLHILMANEALAANDPAFERDGSPVSIHNTAADAQAMADWHNERGDSHYWVVMADCLDSGVLR
jgi:hypothetical protein